MAVIRGAPRPISPSSDPAAVGLRSSATGSARPWFGKLGDASSRAVFVPVRDIEAALGSIPNWYTEQDRRLRALLDHTYRTVPYYRALLSAAMSDPATSERRPPPGVAGYLPVTTKQDLRDAGYDVCISNVFDRASLHLQDTSGSSGRPFKVYRERNAERLRSGYLLRALVAAGFRLGDRLLTWS